MALDPILLWFALFFAVVALARGDGKLWQVKGVLVIGAGAGLVWLWPERAGIIIGTVGLLLLALPLMLSQVVNRMIVAQRFSLGWRIDVLVWLTHPERRWRVQIRTLRALAWAARGRIDDALAVLDAIARDPRAPASMALVARMHVARLQNRWDSFIAMQDWRGKNRRSRS